MNDDDDLESRLGRIQPADPPPELVRRLRESEPPARAARFPWPRAVGRVLDSWRQPWPLAYAALLAVWALILALRAVTPAAPESAAPTAQAGPMSPDGPVFAGTILFARNHSDQL